MSSSLLVILAGVAVVAAVLSAAFSAPRRGGWPAAVIVGALVVGGLWLFADAIVGAEIFAGESLVVQLAAIVSLIFVPWTAVQYVREAIADMRPADTARGDAAADPSSEIVVPAEGSRAYGAAARASALDEPDGPRTSESRLRAAQAHFRDFADHSRAGMWIQDARTGELVYVSPAFEAIWGCRREQLYAAPHERVEAIHPEDRARVGDALVRAAAGRELDEEYRVERPDGSVRWVWDRAVPVRDVHGRVLRLAGMTEDITQRKGVEEVNLFRANFVANMSHEVRTPLNIMIGYLEFLLDGTFGELSQQQREITERVRKNAEELLDLMSASLDLSRLDNRTIPLVIEAVDVGELLGDVAGDMSKLLPNGEVSLRADVEDELPLLQSDRQKIKMVVKNLLSNAVKFTPKGEIIVAARRVGTGAEISVRDTGVGIDAEMLPRVFEPFRQGGTPGGERAGVGLGLYIVRRLVDILEGRISVESTVGRGTAFRVWLPPALSSEREAEGEESAAAAD